MSHILFLEEEKTEGDNKIIPHLAFILVPKNCPTMEIKKKVLWSRKA
jgi:hypothetical protein